MQGVNLGGWLLVEKWMTPSLFDGTDAIDEYTLMKTPGAVEKLEHHRKTFITEADFMWLHKHGIKAIRLPVGYWALRSDSPFIDATVYIDWVMEMSSRYNLSVVIDLHGLKGSQNGYDHSGRAGPARWLHNASYRRQSVATLVDVAKRYKNHSCFWGLQITNEPRVGILQLTLRRYYKQAYSQLSKILLPQTNIIFSDAFSPRLLSLTLRRAAHPVMMDVHLYHMTTFLSQFFSVEWYFKKMARRHKMLQRLTKVHSIMIGEWSGVMRGETMKTVKPDKREALFRRYVTIQQRDYGQFAAQFYWSYKTEQPGEWNFRSEVERGAILL